MEDFVLFVVVIVVFCLAMRRRVPPAVEEKIEDLGKLISRLEARVASLERAPRPAPVVSDAEPKVAKIVAPPIQHGPFVRPAVTKAEPARAHIDDAVVEGFLDSRLESEPAAAPRIKGPAPAVVQPTRVELPRLFESSAATERHRSISMEERLGANWLNKLGIVTLIIGLALFLGYRLRTLGPVGKSAIGLTLSIALLVGGLLLERRARYRIFGRAAIGGGWALTFFVMFALYHVSAMQVLHSQAVDLVLMLLVAGAMVAHSLHYKSQVVTSLAFLLAFVTVGISEVTLFSLVAGALLAAGLVNVAAREYWFELGLAGLVGVYANHFFWLHRVLPGGAQPNKSFPEYFASAGLLLFYWLIFRLFYVLRVPKTERQEVVSSLAAIVNSAGLVSLLKFQSSHPEWAFRGLLVLGAMEMVLAFLARRRWRTAFIVLSSIASILLMAAIPFRFGGSNWSLLWLLEAEMLFVAGVRMREVVFRRLALIGGFAAALQILAVSVPPIFAIRQTQPDPSGHLPVAIALVAAAVLFWLNAEFAPRRWSSIREGDFEFVALPVTSYLAWLSLATGLWVLMPGVWTIFGWLVACLMLGFVADKIASIDLATQADLLAAAALARAIGINFLSNNQAGALSPRTLTVMIAAALLYVCMRRKTRAHRLSGNYIPMVYSWAAMLLLAALAWYVLQPISIALAWGVFGLVLFELGIVFRRDYLRKQGYVLLAASFVRIFFSNLNAGSPGHLLSPRLFTVAPLIAVYFWVYERLRSEAQESRFEAHACTVAAWLGTCAVAALLYFEVRPEWLVIAWAAFALLLGVTAWALKRELFVAQALTLLVATAARALLFHLFSATPLAPSMTMGRVFCVSSACGLLLMALPFAFRIRRQFAGAEADEFRRLILYRPEQPFFFVPLALVTVLLAIELRAGMITIGWSALGVLVFLFALAVGERSYRLAGLSLLMLGVAKIICIDIWHAAPSDRYITLIVMGAALLLVSFLYSRYRETILKFL